MKKATYIKCPRCELNYIKSTDKFCHVCLTELKLAGESTSSDDELELCPICGVNYIKEDETMCEDCMAKNIQTNGEFAGVKNWKNPKAPPKSNALRVRLALIINP